MATAAGRTPRAQEPSTARPLTPPATPPPAVPAAAPTPALTPVPVPAPAEPAEAAPARSGPYAPELFPSWVPWKPPRVPIERTQSRWVRFLVPIIIFCFAFGFYQFQVDHPPIIVFDEAHYVKVARNFTRGVFIDPAWSDPRPQNFEHPPVGKYIIAAGIWLNGKPHDDMENQAYITTLCGHDNPECAPDAKGWRFGSTVVGASGIAAAYFVGLRFFNRFSAGILCSALLLFDGLYFMHARLAMLDIFPTAFTIWAFAFVFSPYRSGPWLSSVFYGLALASKYYALYVLPVFLLCHFLRARAPRWREEPAAHDLETAKGRFLSAFEPVRPWLQRLVPAVMFGFGLPLLVLVATYAPYFVLWSRDGGILFAIKEWFFVQGSALTWDFAADATHPYSSPPSTWLLMTKPVYYYTIDYSGGDVGKMWSVGNPFVWWTAIIGLVFVGLKIVTRFFRDYGWHYLSFDFLDRLVFYPFWLRRDLVFVVTGLLFLSAYLPWFLIQRITFLFYMTFVVPVFAIFAGGLLAEQWDRGGFPRVLAIVYAVLAAAVFMLFYPISTGIRISKPHYEWVMGLLPFLEIST